MPPISAMAHLPLIEARHAGTDLRRPADEVRTQRRRRARSSAVNDAAPPSHSKPPAGSGTAESETFNSYVPPAGISPPANQPDASACVPEYATPMTQLAKRSCC